MIPKGRIEKKKAILVEGILVFQVSIDNVFILTHLWVFILITHPFSKWIIEMHVLFAIDHIHNPLKAFCSDVGRPPGTFESETL